MLPPVAVAAFDPQSERYVTKVTRSVAIRVVEVPRLDPAVVAYQPPPPRADYRPTPVSLRQAAAVCALLCAALLARAAARRWRIDPAWWLVRRARRIAPHDEPAQTAREIADTLAGYLERATGRPRGALTPDEAGTAIAAASGDLDLGTQAAGLIAQCDRACYASADREPRSTELIAEARCLFEAIGRKRRS
jgi:hypothetical protein